MPAVNHGVTLVGASFLLQPLMLFLRKVVLLVLSSLKLGFDIKVS